jgi:cell division protein FtsB
LVTSTRDVWSLGLTIYEMLTGQPLFEQKQDGYLDRIDSDVRPAVVAKAGRELEMVIKSCWNRDPNRRMTLFQIARLFSEVEWNLVDGADPKATKEFLALFPLDAGASHREFELRLKVQAEEIRELKSVLESGTAGASDSSVNRLEAENVALDVEVSMKAQEVSALKAGIAYLLDRAGARSCGKSEAAPSAFLARIQQGESATQRELELRVTAQCHEISMLKWAVGSRSGGRVSLSEVELKVKNDALKAEVSAKAREIATLEGGLAYVMDQSAKPKPGKDTSVTGIPDVEGEWVQEALEEGVRKALDKIKLPLGVTAIGDGAFSDCDHLTEVDIPDGVTSIGDYAFYGCFSLKEVTIPSRVATLGSYVFCGCSGLKKVTLRCDVTTIRGWAFCGCSGLVEVLIPEGVTTIGCYAFEGCSSLIEMVIPAMVEIMDDCAFKDCSGLKRLTTPSRFKVLGGDVFLNVQEIEYLHLLGSQLSSSVVASLADHLSSTARVIGPDLTGEVGAFGNFKIAPA